MVLGLTSVPPSVFALSDVVWRLVGAVTSAIYWSGALEGRAQMQKTGVPSAGKAVVPWPHCETFWEAPVHAPHLSPPLVRW
jgi:hypothetical protein